MNLPHYPRTLHIGDSGGGTSRHRVDFSAVAGKILLVEEKIDGSHCGLLFDQSANLVLFSRHAILQSPPLEPDFAPLFYLATAHREHLWQVLTDRYVLYGEWTYAAHSIYYDNLPAYFLEDDIYDRRAGYFLSTAARLPIVVQLPKAFGHSVPVLAKQTFTQLSELRTLVKQSAFISKSAEKPAQQNRPKTEHHLQNSALMEGLYIKREQGDQLLGRYKWIRPQFLEHIQKAGAHWRRQQFLQNQIRQELPTP